MNTTDSGVPAERHAHSTYLCEQCLAMLASSRNPFHDWLKECAYSTGEIVRHSCASLMQFLDGVAVADAREDRAIRARVRAHTHEAGQRICTICLGSCQSTGLAACDTTKEHLHTLAEVLLLIGKYAAIGLFGLAMIVATVFPKLLRSSPTPEEDREREWEENRRKQDEEKDWAEFEQVFREVKAIRYGHDQQDYKRMTELRCAVGAHQNGTVSSAYVLFLAKRLLAERMKASGMK